MLFANSGRNRQLLTVESTPSSSNESAPFIRVTLSTLPVVVTQIFTSTR